MPHIARDFDDYATALTCSFEEEVVGEAFYRELALHLTGPAKTACALLARIETATIAVLGPLIARHALTPRPIADLAHLGRNEARACDSWTDLLRETRDTYDAYLQEFQATRRMAPAADLPRIDALVAHEQAIIAFAARDLAGDPASLAPLHAYLTAVQALDIA